MAFSKRDALDAARAIIEGARTAEQPRLDRINAWTQPGRVPAVELPKGAPAVMQRLAAKSESNYLPLVVKSFSQGMKVDGYYSPKSPDRSPLWEHWQRNRNDARQTGTHRVALKYGVGYELLLPGDPGPVSQGLSPRRMTAVYQDPATDEWPMMALDIDGSMLRLIDEEQVYYIGAENRPRGALEAPILGSGRLTFIEARAHDAGVCPVVRFRDRFLLDGEEQFGIVEPLIALQSRIDETNFGLLIAQFFAAFKQRYVIGWIPKDEAEEMRSTASDVWYFADGDVKVGQFNETDLEKYIAAKADAKRDLSALAQVPIQNFGTDGISNISGDTLTALTDANNDETDEIETSLGESWEQWFRLCAHYTGDDAAAADFSGEVRWADKSARAFAETVDGLGKIATMLQYPVELLWEQIPGQTQTDISRATQLRKRQQAQERLQGLAAAAAQARQDPQVAQVAAQRGPAQ